MHNYNEIIHDDLKQLIENNFFLDMWNKPEVDYLFDQDIKDEGIKHIQMVKSYYMTHKGDITYNDLRNLLCPVKDEAIICYRENLYAHYTTTKAGIGEAEQFNEILP